MILLQKGLNIHGDKAPDDLRPFHDHMEMRFAQMKEFVDQDFTIHVCLNCIDFNMLCFVANTINGETIDLAKSRIFSWLLIFLYVHVYYKCAFS